MKITLSRVFSIAFAIVLLAKALKNNKLRIGGRSGVLLFIWLMLSLAVDLFYASEIPTVHHWINLAIGVIWFYAIVNLNLDWEKLQRTTVAVGAVIGSLSVLALCARAVSYDPLGITDYLAPRVVDLYRLVMFSWEPNIFGTIIAVALILILPKVQQSPKRYGLIWLSLLITLIGTLSKGPWVAFIIGLTIYAVISRARRIMIFDMVMLYAIIIIASLVVLSSNSTIESSIIRPENVTVRLMQDQKALVDIRRAPLFGHGTFSFGDIWPYLNYRFGDHQMNAAWISQAMLGVLHDTGIVGLIFMLGFWINLMFSGIRSIESSRRAICLQKLRFMSAALAAGFILLAEDWVTTLYALPVYWAVMGIVAMIPFWASERSA